MIRPGEFEKMKAKAAVASESELARIEEAIDEQMRLAIENDPMVTVVSFRLAELRADRKTVQRVINKYRQAGWKRSEISTDTVFIR